MRDKRQGQTPGAWRLQQDLQQLGFNVLEMPDQDALPSYIIVRRMNIF